MTLLDRMIPGSSGRFRNFLTQGLITGTYEATLEEAQNVLHNVGADIECLIDERSDEMHKECNREVN